MCDRSTVYFLAFFISSHCFSASPNPASQLRSSDKHWHALSNPLTTSGTAMLCYDMRDLKTLFSKEEVTKKLRKARCLEVYGPQLSILSGDLQTNYKLQWQVIDEVLREPGKADGCKIKTLVIHHMLHEDHELQPTLRLRPHLTSLVLASLSHY